MNKTFKKVMTVLATLTIGATALSSLGACTYNYPSLGDFSQVTDVQSNGGWVVQATLDGKKYVYFINGQPNKTGTEDENNVAYEDNVFNEVTKGALCRAEVKSDGSYGETEMVVPLIVTGENYQSGIFIQGEYVYYASPTVTKNISGQVETGYLDFKRSRLDGTETMQDYYFRSATATAEFRFVEVDGAVYCLHVDENNNLYSYKVDGEGGEDTLLAKGVTSYAFDKYDTENPYVYYTMGVTLDVDQEANVPMQYNQIYRVRADATAKLSDSKKEGYRAMQVSGKADGYSYEYTYEFDADALQKQADKDKDDDIEFNKNEMEDYPYVNLGQPVLDGISSNSEISQYNQNVKADTVKPTDGYTYTLVQYANDGIYYTRANCKSVTATEGAWTYYLDETKLTGSSDPAAMNAKENNVVIGTKDTKANAGVFFVKEGNKHSYFYTEKNTLIRKNLTQTDGGAPIETNISQGTAVVDQYLFIEDGYLYYTVSGGDFVDVWRTKILNEDYNGILGDKNNTVSVFSVKHVAGWYAPEIIDGNVFFVDNTLVGGTLTYGYPHVISFKGMDNDAIADKNEKIDADVEIRNLVADNFASASMYISYYFYTDGGLPSDDYKVSDLKNDYFAQDEADLLDEVIQDKVQSAIDNDKIIPDDNTTFFMSQQAQDCINAYLKGEKYVYNNFITFDFDKLNYKYYGSLFTMIGMEDQDEDVQNDMHNAWKSYLGGVADDDSWPTWVWVLIWVGVGVASVGVLCGVGIPVALHFVKKKGTKAAKPRKKIVVDMNVDEDLDVYADPNAESQEEPEAVLKADAAEEDTNE